ncbi:MAG: hypothetical protein O2780_12710 [Proteobacteria bacterium]|jgi:RNA polymerase subunit RPABC4/transcription elongation factor Spt4|nr:hypothetical protein [Pseudomonadota bacterium]MDA1301978.1 hypothetical protein [Pseudomonadota bacterium]
MARCLQCGMLVTSDWHHCPKCDNDLTRQTDGSTVTGDIAHHGEHIAEALDKLNAMVQQERAGLAARLRLIVGGGLIRKAAIEHLETLKFRGDILGYHQDNQNSGVIIAILKTGPGS